MKTIEKIGNGTNLVIDDELKYIEFECLKEFDEILTHCMSTRLGGISSGECSALNLGFNRKDSRENVLENYRLLCKAAGLETSNLVMTNQVHDIRKTVTIIKVKIMKAEKQSVCKRHGFLFLGGYMDV